MVVAGIRWGKDLALQTPICAPSGGFVPLGSLIAGDQVLDEFGQPAFVTGASPIRYHRGCFRVSFDRGESIVADEDHLWVTRSLHTPPRNVTTAQIRDTLRSGHLIDRPADGERFLVTAVERVPSVPVRCIAVDSPNSLFLAGKSLIPTHNSFLGPVWHYRRVVRNRGAKFSLIVAPDYKLAKNICLGYYREFLVSMGLREGLRKDFVINRADLIIAFPAIGHQIVILSGEKPDKIIGYTSSHAWIDEAARCPEDVRNNVLQRNSYACNYQQILYTTTPEGTNWLHTQFGPDKTTRHIGTPYSESETKLVLHGKTHDNPYLSERYLRTLEREFSWDEAYYANYVLGEWVSLSRDRFYFRFDEKNHVGDFPADPENRRLYMSWDSNVGHMTWVAIQPRGAAYHVVADNASKGQNVYDACEQFIAAFPPHIWGRHIVSVFGDATLHHRSELSHETPYQHIRHILKPAYPNVTIEAPYGNPMVDERSRTSNRLFAENRLLVDRGCKTVIMSARSTETHGGTGVRKTSTDKVTHAMEAVDMAMCVLDPSPLHYGFFGIK